MPADHLVIRLPHEEGAAPQFARVGDAQSGHPVDVLTGEPPAPGEDTRVIVLVPSEHVLHTSARVPVKGTAKILQTIPFALEDQIAEDIAELHFAIGKRDEDGAIPVAVAAAADMEAWQETVAQYGFTAKRVYAESALLHPPGRSAVMLIEGDTVQFVAPGQPSLVVGADDLPFLLETLERGGSATTAGDAAAAIVESPDAVESTVSPDEASAEPEDAVSVQADQFVPPSMLTVFASPDDLDRHAEVLGQLEAKLGRVERRALLEGAFTLLARQAVEEDQAINLAQGNFAPPSQLGSLWVHWRVAAVVMLAFFVTVLGGKGLQLSQLSAEDARLRAEIANVLRETCPSERAIVDPEQQMRNCVRSLGGASGPIEEELFLTMLTSLAGALGQIPDTRIEQISFLSRKMDLKLMAPGVDSVERIKQAVAGRGGLELLIEQTRPRPEGVEFQIELTRKPSA
jgi:general secretion pathway protein L